MRRSLVIVGAWLLVTAVSVLVAYAAVGQVRDRVVEQPQLVSSAASTGVGTSLAPTTTVAPTMVVSTTSPVASTTSEAVTTTSIAATGSTAAPTATAAPATTAAPTTTTTPPAQGRIETYSTPGGSVSIEIFPDHLTLLGAVPATGFSVAEQEIAPTQIEIEFKGNGQEVHFHATLDDGDVVIDVETDEGDD